MARDLYNLLWIGPQDIDTRLAGALQTPLTVDSRSATTRGVILFPALMTPFVLVEGKDEPWIELMVATEHPLTPDMVNRQLKISAGLRPSKPYDPSPIFGGAGDKIVVEKAGITSLAQDVALRTHSRFEGILHGSVLQPLWKANLTNIFRVRIHRSALRGEAPGGEQKLSRLVEKFVEYRAGDDGNPVRVVREASVGTELQDAMISTMLANRFGHAQADGSPLPGQGRYAFPVQGNTVDLSKADRFQPIQSYHPVVVLGGEDAFTYASFAHISDIHVNCRWQILGQSSARVIEYGEGQNEAESPKIGELLAETNRSFHDVLHGVSSSDAHVVIVGGDIVDHIRNAYSPARIVSKDSTVHQIWDAMNLDTYDERNYPPGVDLVAFYSFIFDAMVKHRKPFFAVSGNHDCYEDAYGISPRLLGIRTNAGIPSDLNLTLYEALLAFGRTGGMLVKAASSFDPSWFEWFHLVLTPFNDWWFKLPGQSLVGLGWGGHEDLFDKKGDQGSPGWLPGGHLPRADDAITGAQLALLQRAVDERQERKVILTTHFTFLSYREDVPMSPGGVPGSRGEMRTSGLGPEEYTQWEMGTFERNRAAVMNMLSERQIQCVLSGHSHRRGVHLLLDRNGSTLPALLYDPEPGRGLDLAPLPRGATHAEPAIVVSDSAGPYPRHNHDGEFRGWGADRPGGTVVRFDPRTGDLENVRTIAATSRPKPRAAVAMDYLDIEQSAVFKDNRMFVTALSSEWDSGAGGPQDMPGYMVHPNFHDEVRNKLGIHVRRMIFAGLDTDSKTWIRVDLGATGDQEAVAVPVALTKAFRRWLRTAVSRFVSLQLGTRVPWLSSRYDWESHWNFEIHAVPRYGQSVVDRTGRAFIPVTYSLARPAREIETRLLNKENWREIPPFDWLVQTNPKYAPG